jgi:hypothetical protein
MSNNLIIGVIAGSNIVAGTLLHILKIIKDHKNYIINIINHNEPICSITVMRALCKDYIKCCINFNINEDFHHEYTSINKYGRIESNKVESKIYQVNLYTLDRLEREVISL